MAETPLPPVLAPPSLLQFTDRSRHELRIGRCPRAAYLSTAFGPSGYGIQRRYVSVPLASGSMFHTAIGQILEWCKVEDALPPDDVVRHAILAAQTEYDALVVTRGLSYWEGDEQLQRTTREQRILIEALVWCWVLEKLPPLLDEYIIRYVETEEVMIVGCTCGLGDGIGVQADHDARECQGIGIQTKADWIGERRDTPEYFAYHEFKTFGGAPGTWASRWQTAIQPYVGALGWEARTGKSISATYVHGLYKGPRKKEKAAGDVGRTYTGPEFQDSRLVYGYLNPGAPPLEPADWQPEYEWWDGTRTRRLGPSYKKALVDAYPGGTEAWVRHMTSAQRQEQVLTIGPLLPRTEVVRAYLRGWTATEQKVRLALWDLYQLLQSPDIAGDWTHLEVQTLLDQEFPQSWQCDRYGAHHRCEYLPICNREAGWEDPINALAFIVRRPHHEPELLQMRARGLEPPDDQGTDEDE